MHCLDESEVEVFRFWVDRLQREFRSVNASSNEIVT